MPDNVLNYRDARGWKKRTLDSDNLGRAPKRLDTGRGKVADKGAPRPLSHVSTSTPIDYASCTLKTWLRLEQPSPLRLRGGGDDDIVPNPLLPIPTRKRAGFSKPLPPADDQGDAATAKSASDASNSSSASSSESTLRHITSSGNTPEAVAIKNTWFRRIKNLLFGLGNNPVPIVTPNLNISSVASALNLPPPKATQVVSEVTGQLGAAPATSASVETQAPSSSGTAPTVPNSAQTEASPATGNAPASPAPAQIEAPSATGVPVAAPSTTPPGTPPSAGPFVADPGGTQLRVGSIPEETKRRSILLKADLVKECKDRGVWEAAFSKYTKDKLKAELKKCDIELRKTQGPAAVAVAVPTAAFPPVGTVAEELKKRKYLRKADLQKECRGRGIWEKEFEKYTIPKLRVALTANDEELRKARVAAAGAQKKGKAKRPAPALKGPPPKKAKTGLLPTPPPALPMPPVLALPVPPAPALPAPPPPVPAPPVPPAPALPVPAAPVPPPPVPPIPALPGPPLVPPASALLAPPPVPPAPVPPPPPIPPPLPPPFQLPIPPSPPPLTPDEQVLADMATAQAEHEQRTGVWWHEGKAKGGNSKKGRKQRLEL